VSASSEPEPAPDAGETAPAAVPADAGDAAGTERGEDGSSRD
jgi:hypothetical protein